MQIIPVSSVVAIKSPSVEISWLNITSSKNQIALTWTELHVSDSLTVWLMNYINTIASICIPKDYRTINRTASNHVSLDREITVKNNLNCRVTTTENLLFAELRKIK